MNIYTLPWGDYKTASSRLRIYNIGPHIENYFIGVPSDNGGYDMANYGSAYKKGDVLIIQKTPQIGELKKARKEGARIIYDIDDRYETPEFIEMIKEADIVTTDTEEKKKWLDEFNDNVVVIPDSLDWDGTIKEKYGHKGIIGWTGYGNNSAHLNNIEIPKEFKLRLVTSSDWLQYYKDNQAQSRPWSLEMVDKYLAECDLGLHFLPDSDFENSKGMHKLLKNWAIGLPTYTSAMPDYVKAMHEAGVGDKYIITKGNQIKDIEFDPKLREYALRYEAKNIATLWQKTIQNLK